MSVVQLLIFISLCVLNVNVQALKCYNCGAAEGLLDQGCVNDPESVENGVVSCNKDYCISVRVEYIDPKDKVQSVVRGCSDKIPIMNQVIEDPTFRTYYKGCQTDLCNGGSGKDLSGTGGLFGKGSGDDIVLLVPGIGFPSSALTLSYNLFLIIVIAISVLTYNI